MPKNIIEPVCAGCGKRPAELEEYVVAVAELNEYRAWRKQAPLSPDDYVRREDGTYNPENGHFLCTPCYVAAGQPSSRTGWKAP